MTDFADRDEPTLPPASTPHSGAPTRSWVEAAREQLQRAVPGEYEVEEEIGRGGMAVVFRARDLSLDRPVAIKVLAPYLLDLEENIVERFRREARTAARLSHPHIIPVHQVRQTENLLFFVMKLVQGKPLDAVIRDLGRLPIPMVETILSQVGTALHYAHRQGVIHRDIKPANIMLDDEGYAVITDFGVAKVQSLQALSDSKLRLGTPLYMSPEQCAGGAVTAAADQYGLGVSLYEMIAGRVPFEGHTVQQVANAHIMADPAPLRPIRPDCPGRLAEGVLRMLGKEPKDRWPDLQVAVEGCTGQRRPVQPAVQGQMAILAQGGTQHQDHGLSLFNAPTIPLTDNTHPSGSGASKAPGDHAAGSPPVSPSLSPRARLLLLGGLAVLVAALLRYLRR